MSDSLQNVNDVSKAIKSIIKDDINKSNIMTAVLQGVIVMEKFTKITGDQKKRLLIDSLHFLTTTSDVNIEDKMAINIILESVVPSAIDSMVWIANSGFKKISSSCCGI